MIKNVSVDALLISIEFDKTVVLIKVGEAVVFFTAKENKEECYQFLTKMLGDIEGCGGWYPIQNLMSIFGES